MDILSNKSITPEIGMMITGIYTGLTGVIIRIEPHDGYSIYHTGASKFNTAMWDQGYYRIINYKKTRLRFKE